MVLTRSTPPAGGEPGRGADAAHVRSVVDAVLEYPLIADPQFRQSLVSLLPRRLADGIRRLAAPRPDIASIVQACSRNPADLWSLVDALRVLSDTPRVNAVVEAAVTDAVGPRRT